MVEYRDGAVVAQLGMPDMKGPIAYALSYPERLADVSPALDLAKVGTLTFEEPDMDRFPCLAYALMRLKRAAACRRCSRPRTRWRSNIFWRKRSATATSPA